MLFLIPYFHTFSPRADGGAPAYTRLSGKSPLTGVELCNREAYISYQVYDKYSVIQELRIIAYPILANRLMLNLRESDDYDTRTAVSVIMFTPGPASSGDTDDEENSDDEDVPLTSMATGIQSRSAVARGTTAVDAV
ncbi:hypothetical protein MD484_g4867, partial [Candolleomyces efflorescens]